MAAAESRAYSVITVIVQMIHTSRLYGKIGRFKAILMDKDSYFAEVLRYVVLNPVRAKMCERKSRRFHSRRAIMSAD